MVCKRLKLCSFLSFHRVGDNRKNSVPLLLFLSPWTARYRDLWFHKLRLHWRNPHNHWRKGTRLSLTPGISTGILLWTRILCRTDLFNACFVNTNDFSREFKKNQWKYYYLWISARHLCTYRQLVGVCGDIEIPTPYTIKESFWMDDPDLQNQGTNLEGNQNDNNIDLRVSFKN